MLTTGIRLPLGAVFYFAPPADSESTASTVATAASTSTATATPKPGSPPPWNLSPPPIVLERFVNPVLEFYSSLQGMFNVFPYGLQYKHDMGSTMSGMSQQQNRDTIATVANALGAVKNESCTAAHTVILYKQPQFVGTFDLTSTATVTDLYPGILRAVQDIVNSVSITGIVDETGEFTYAGVAVEVLFHQPLRAKSGAICDRPDQGR